MNLLDRYIQLLELKVEPKDIERYKKELESKKAEIQGLIEDGQNLRQLISLDVLQRDGVFVGAIDLESQVKELQELFHNECDNHEITKQVVAKLKAENEKLWNQRNFDLQTTNQYKSTLDGIKVRESLKAEIESQLEKPKLISTYEEHITSLELQVKDLQTANDYQKEMLDGYLSEIAKLKEELEREKSERITLRTARDTSVEIRDMTIAKLKEELEMEETINSGLVGTIAKLVEKDGFNLSMIAKLKEEALSHDDFKQIAIFQVKQLKSKLDKIKALTESNFGPFTKLRKLKEILAKHEGSPQ